MISKEQYPHALGRIVHDDWKLGRQVGRFEAFEPVPAELKAEGRWEDDIFHFAAEGQPHPFVPSQGIGYLLWTEYGYRWLEEPVNLQDIDLCAV